MSRQSEVEKIAEILASNGVSVEWHEHIMTEEEYESDSRAYRRGIAKDLVDNGIRSKDGFEMKWCDDIGEERIEPLNYKEEA